MMLIQEHISNGTNARSEAQHDDRSEMRDNADEQSVGILLAAEYFWGAYQCITGAKMHQVAFEATTWQWAYHGT